MRFGVALPSFGPKARDPELPRRLRNLAVAAERLGYDVLWTAEHLILPSRLRTPYPYATSPPFDPTDPVLDTGATLSWIAGFTERIALGSSVIVLPYHHPIALAKTLATLDLLSGGRLILGVAGGWLREEFELLGVPFGERGARTDEAIDLLRKLWTEDRVNHAGRFFTVEDAAFFPKPAQRPHPPIWIGGGSPAALRRVGRAGDGWMAVPTDLDGLRAGLDVVRREAERCGRDPGAVGAASSGGAHSVAELLDLLPVLERVGVTIVNVPAIFWARELPEAIDLMAEFAERAGFSARGESLRQ
jgi:probable F420-dependent oxidoreductase